MGPVKVPFAESDLVPLIKRYSSATVVTMLREIARCKSARLDWVVLCKGTATGITNPKEYQAVWRSIAYRAELADSFDANNDAPLEDDSDMEVDLDPVPSVSPAVAGSIAGFVKADLHQHGVDEARVEQSPVQMGVGLQGGGGGIATARLQQCAATNGGDSAAALTCSTSKAIYAGAVNQSDRKRRRLWTPEEDLALIAAVDKCGEGNWTTVLKNHYDFDRSASQLSQRWALIRKRREVQEKAGYVGSGVSPLASGYKDVRPEGLKGPGTLLAAGPDPQLGTPKDVGTFKSGTLAAAGAGSQQIDVGRPGNKIMSTSGSVPMSVKQPISSTSTVPVSKRLPVGSTPATGTETAPASIVEMQRVRASGASPSWAGVPGQRPQSHNQAPMMRAGASGAGQAHRGGVASEAHAPGVRRPAGAQGSQIFYTSSQPVTSTIDSKYAASRNMGAGVARGGVSKGSSHGPDPMIQAAAMAAGARIAPASAAASLLMAAQSGNVVHIGSGGLPRSKLGLTSQGGSGNAGGSPGIVHYIRTGSGGASLATNGPGLQRASSHHAQKTQSNQPSRGSHLPGNSSPLSAPTVPPQASRNNAQAPVQSSKQIALSKRGSSPSQQKTSPSTLTPNSTLIVASTPASSTPAPTSVPRLAMPSAAAPAQTSGSTPAPKSTSPPAPQTSVARPAAASGATPAPTSGPTPAPKSTSPLAPTSVARPAAASAASPVQTSGPTPAQKSTSPPAPPTSVARPAPASGASRAPTSGPTSARKSTAPPPPPTATATPICGFNTSEPIVDLAEEGTTP